MIAFDSQEGEALRGLQPSRTAKLAIWNTALEQGCDDWAGWARDTLGAVSQDADLVALRFMQAVSDGNERAARQLFAVLQSFPQTEGESRIVTSARTLRASLPD